MWDDPGLWLWCVDGVGVRRYEVLLREFGNAAAALDAGPELCARACKVPLLARRFAAGWPTDERIERLAEFLQDPMNRVMGMSGPKAPSSLVELGDPPWLFLRGEAKILERHGFAAVVGTRRANPSILALTRWVVDLCRERGWATVSGGALGVDGEVHRYSIESGIPTVVVMPCGLGHRAPSSHGHLFESVVESGGCLVTEHPPWRAPRPELFVRRNRLISGLSSLTIVVRAASKSGALITARWAREQGRPLFVVPGSPCDASAIGCLQALKEGARALTEVSDLPEADKAFSKLKRRSEIALRVTLPVSELSPEERDIMEVLGNEPRSLEQIASLLRYRLSETVARVTGLLIDGRLQMTEAGLYKISEI